MPDNEERPKEKLKILRVGEPFVDRSIPAKPQKKVSVIFRLGDTAIRNVTIDAAAAEDEAKLLNALKPFIAEVKKPHPLEGREVEI